MKNPECERVRDLLSPRLDGELAATAERDVSIHLAACSACLEEFRRIEHGRQLTTLLPERLPPAFLRRELLHRLRPVTHARPRQAIWRRPAVALGTLAVAVLAAAGAWTASTGRQDTAPRDPASVAIGEPLRLDRLTQAVGTTGQLEALAARYELREVNVEEALRRASFKVLCPLQAEPGETIDERHLTELRACPLVHLSALRGEHRIVMLQQPAGWPIIYGGAPVEHVTIAGQPCERLRIGEHEIIKWERGGTRSIMVGAAHHPEVTKVARALISAAS